ncbi:hypothetical protein GCM10027020_21650 [Nocardioides salsibiostraticola]
MPTSSTTATAVYGDDRVRRLRIALGSLAGTALVGLVLGLYVLVAGEPGDADARRSGIVLAALSAVLLSAAAATWVRLPRRTAGVRRAAAACGALALLSALPTAGLILGFVWAVIGLGIVFLAIGPDEP